MDPYSKLASLLDLRMSERASAALDGVPAELGTVTESGLKLDTFKHEIRDYLVADWRVKLRVPAFSLTGTVSGLRDGEGRAVSGVGSFSFEAADIEDAQWSLKDALKPGDRVMAIPVSGGTEAVVLCKVVK